MIVVREVFQLQFGKAKEAIALVKEFAGMLAKKGYPGTRILTDRTGQFYTLVMETQFEGLGAFEKAEEEMMSIPEFRAWYPKLVPLINSGCREIYNLVESG